MGGQSMDEAMLTAFDDAALEKMLLAQIVSTFPTFRNPWTPGGGDRLGDVRDRVIRLIAAAPELLEALRSLANDASGFVSMADPAAHGHTNIAVLRHHIEAARAAITKASPTEITGEKP